MTRKLSAWSKPGEKPPCVGVWETNYANKTEPTYQWFDGNKFMNAASSPSQAFLKRKIKSLCNQSTICFRGLAEKTK